MDAQQIASVLGKAKASHGGWVALCPCHDDSTPSLSITDSGDKILVHCHAGCPQDDVIATLKSMHLWPEKEKKVEQKKIISDTYNYFDANGTLVFQVVRYEPKDFRQRRPDGSGWSWSVPKEIRVLYNLPAIISADPLKSIFIVEGEKDVQTLASIGCIATCNAGGAGKWDRRYNDSLAGRNIIILPDNDEPGRNHAALVARELIDVAKTIRIVELPGLPPKGDVSDWVHRGGTVSDLRELCRSASVVARSDIGQTDSGTADAADENNSLADTPFRPLGFNAGTYYYLSLETQQVIALTGPQHTKMNLFTIAPLQWWQREFPAKTGTDWDSAADTMMRLCTRRGIFSPEILRGRGAWYDDGRIVLHLGDKLYVDKTPFSPISVQSRWVYERALPMHADIDDSLSVDEGKQFLDLIEMLPWASDMDAAYLAGWCVIAHIGGVMNWRPHVWVTGSKGSGKSHVMSQIVRPVLGDNCLFVVSETTEAGVRQSLRHDSLPVLFDEAEGEDQRSQDRLQRILALVRQSSSETGGKIAKGTVSGHAMSFQIRSCFAFSSINASLIQQSDASRVTVVELRQDRRKVDFETLVAAETRLLTDLFITRFYARAIRLAGVIRANAQTFSRVVAALMGEQRAGDQLGTLLAGCWSLRSDDIVTFEAASEWIHSHDWIETKADVQSQSDEKNLLDFILQQVVKIQTGTGQRDRTIGELVDDVRMNQFDSEVSQRALGRLGLRVDGLGLIVSNTADGLRRLLKTTPWAVSWSKVLRRLPGAEPKGVSYFGYPGSESRAVWVPLPTQNS